MPLEDEELTGGWILQDYSRRQTTRWTLLAYIGSTRRENTPEGLSSLKKWKYLAFVACTVDEDAMTI
jgi:hypothetical protein